MELGWMLLLMVGLASSPTPEYTIIDFPTSSACQSAGVALVGKLTTPPLDELRSVNALCIERNTGKSFWAVPSPTGPVK